MSEETLAILWVDLDRVEQPQHLARHVDETSEKFAALHESMAREGFWPSQPLEVTDSGNGTYIIASGGMHRYAAARKLKLAKIPIVVLARSLTEGERLARQVLAESTHTQMRPAETGRTLRNLQDLPEYRNLTKVDFARKVGQSPEFVEKALNLATLPESIGEAADNGEIRLGNALALAQLLAAGRSRDPAYAIPVEAVAKARREDVGAFRQQVSLWVQAIRKGPPARKETPARLRPLPDVRSELERVQKDPLGHPERAAALAWVLRQDRVSASAEQASPALTGLEEPARLRSELVQNMAALEAERQVSRGQADRATSLEREVERLNRIIDERDSVIRALEKGRKPEGASA